MDVAPDGTWLVAVREDHRGEGEAKNEIVRIDTTTGEERVLVTGPDFVASPRVDARGTDLAWTQWNHPDMPWDAGRGLAGPNPRRRLTRHRRARRRDGRGVGLTAHVEAERGSVAHQRRRPLPG